MVGGCETQSRGVRTFLPMLLTHYPAAAAAVRYRLIQLCLGRRGILGRGNKLISFSSSSHYWEESGRKGLRAAVGISASNRLIGHVSALQPESILQNFMGEEALPISMDWINT